MSARGADVPCDGGRFRRPRAVVAAVTAFVALVGLAVSVGAATGEPGSGAALAVRSGSLAFSTSAVSVPRRAPVVAHAAGGSAVAGVGSVADVVSLSGGTAGASGTLTLRLWRDPACTEAVGPVATAVVSGADGVAYPMSVPTPTVVGLYRFTAQYSGDADDEPATSVCGAPGSSVTVVAGAAAVLAFTSQPGGGRVGAAWAQQPVVAVRDAFGNLVSTTAASVSVAVGSGPSAAVLTCATNPVSASGGSAAFAGCALGAAGSGYTLVATSPGLAGATSAPFDVTAGVAFVATGPVATATANVGTTVVYPAGTAAGDLVLLVVVTANSATTSVPGGWTALADQTAASGTDRLRLTVWWRPAAGESSVSVALKGNPSGASAWVVRYARPGGGGPAIVAATGSVPQGTAAPTGTLTPSPDLVTGAPGATVISIVATRQPDALALAAAAGFAVRTATTSTPVAGGGVALAFADRTVDASGVTVASPTWAQTGAAGAWAWASVAFA